MLLAPGGDFLEGWRGVRLSWVSSSYSLTLGRERLGEKGSLLRW